MLSLLTLPLAVPPQHGVRLEQQDGVIQPSARASRAFSELDSEYREDAFLPYRNAGGLTELELHDAELVTQQQYLNVFVPVRQTPGDEYVKEQPEDVQDQVYRGVHAY